MTSPQCFSGLTPRPSLNKAHYSATTSQPRPVPSDRLAATLQHLHQNATRAPGSRRSKALNTRRLYDVPSPWQQAPSFSIHDLQRVFGPIATCARCLTKVKLEVGDSCNGLSLGFRPRFIADACFRLPASNLHFKRGSRDRFKSLLRHHDPLTSWASSSELRVSLDVATAVG